MKKTIWIINQDATTPVTGYAGRSFYLAEELSKLGHKVYLIAGGFSHLHFNSPDVSKNIETQVISGFSFVWVRLPRYDNAHSKKRILNWFLFSLKISRLSKILPYKADLIVYSSPPIIGFLGALNLKKQFGAKLVVDIRDIWPLTLTEIGGYSRTNPFILFMSWIEKLIYKKSDKVVSNLSNAMQYFGKFNLSPEKFFWIPNGISFSEMNTAVSLDPFIDNLVPKDRFVVGYCGSLGVANAMEYLIEACNNLKDFKEIYFVIVGTGKEKESLMASVDEDANVLFIDPIPKPQIHSLLKTFQVCYLGWRDHHLYEYGIGSNKLPEYLISGRPIIHSYSGKMDLVSIANAGITVPAENSAAIVAAILDLYKMPRTERDVFGQRGYEFARTNLYYDQLVRKLDDVLI